MKKEIHKLFFLISDFTAAAIVWIVFNTLCKDILGQDVRIIDLKIFINAFLIGAFWVTYYAFLGFYSNIYSKSRIKEILKLFTSSLLGSIIIFFLLLLDEAAQNDYDTYYKIFATYYLLQFSITCFLKMILLAYIKRLVINKKVLFKTVLIGSQSNALEIIDAVERNKELVGFTFVGYFHLTTDKDNVIKNTINHLGSLKELGAYLEKNKTDHVVIAAEQEEHSRIPEILRILDSYNVRISIIPDIYELLLGAVKVNHVFSVPLIQINQDLIPVWQKVIKRFMDIVAALLVLVPGFPFLLLISLITKFTSRGPVFYYQERVGKDGVPFKIYKFRSMHVDAEKKGPALSSPYDPRITSWGRFMRRTKLDEFPQFYNVLIGQMSLVGPRPERQYFIDQIVRIAPHYKHLQRVKPGLTSLGQVKFGYAENVEEMVKRLKYDIIYIENMSLSMDFQIILYTILIMFSGRNR